MDATSIQLSTMQESEEILPLIKIEREDSDQQSSHPSGDRSDIPAVFLGPSTSDLVGMDHEVKLEESSAFIIKEEFLDLEEQECNGADMNLPFQCYHCGGIFSIVSILRKHIKDHHINQLAKIMNTDDNVNTEIIPLEEIRNTVKMDEKPHLCSYCDYRSMKASNLKRHIMYKHTNEKPYKCPYCKYGAVEACNLKAHIRAYHTQEKPHLCPYCEYRSVTSNNLKVHIRTHHTNEKPYSCPHCEYRAVQAGHLKGHIRAYHTQEKPNHCPHCEYRSVTSNNLKVHIKTHRTDEKPHPCPHCEFRAVHAGNLKTHIVVHHTNEKPHKCSHVNIGQ